MWLFMKHICFLTSKIENSGGTEKVSILLANRMVKEGYKVSFFNLIGGAETFFEKEPEISVFSMNLKPGETKKNFFQILFSLRNFVKNNNVNTIVNVDSILVVFSTFSLVGLSVNKICWEHFNCKIDLGVPFRRLGRLLAVIFCDTIVTLTDRDKKLWLDKYQNIKANILNIPNPILPIQSDFLPSLELKTVLAVGRPIEVKGYDMLLEAWAFVCQNIKDWKLCIVGLDDKEIDQLRKLSLNLNITDNVELLKPKKNINDFYLSASIFCMTSRFEGFPMVLLEAQSFNLPIVAFDCDTGPAEIISNNKNGILVEANNIYKLACSLKMLIKNPTLYDQMVAESKLTRYKFSSENFFKSWMEIL